MTEADCPSILEFADLSGFLRAYIQARKASCSGYSYQRLANGMGGVSVSLLHMVAAGQRLPTMGVLERLRSALALNDLEFRYAVALVGLQRAKNAEERAIFVDRIKQLQRHQGP